MLRNRDFAIALAGRSVSEFGDEVALVALTLRLQAGGGHPYQVAVLLGAGLVPFVLLARVAGRVADSADSRRVLLAASLAQACCCVPLIFTGNVAVMAVFAALLGSSAAFAQATWQALLPRIVGEDGIGAASAALQTCVNLAAVLAPAAAGLLSGAFGTHVPVVADVLSFLTMAAAAVAVRTRRAGGRAADQQDERGGWALLRADPVLRPLVLGLAAFVLLGFTVNVVTVFLVRQTLHASATWYGSVGAIWVLGIVGGALAAGRIAATKGHVRSAVAGTGLMSLAFAGYGLAPAVAVLVPVALLGGIGNGMANVSIATLVMTRSQEQTRGRVSAALGALVNAASVTSLVVGGGLAAILAPRQIFLLAAALGGLVTLATAVKVPGAVAAGSARRRSAATEDAGARSGRAQAQASGSACGAAGRPRRSG